MAMLNNQRVYMFSCTSLVKFQKLLFCWHNLQQNSWSLHSNNWHRHCLHCEEVPMLRVAVQRYACLKFSTASARFQAIPTGKRRRGFFESMTNNIDSTFCPFLLAIWKLKVVSEPSKNGRLGGGVAKYGPALPVPADIEQKPLWSPHIYCRIFWGSHIWPSLI